MTPQVSKYIIDTPKKIDQLNQCFETLNSGKVGRYVKFEHSQVKRVGFLESLKCFFFSLSNNVYKKSDFAPFLLEAYCMDAPLDELKSNISKIQTIAEEAGIKPIEKAIVNRLINSRITQLSMSSLPIQKSATFLEPETYSVEQDKKSVDDNEGDDNFEDAVEYQSDITNPSVAPFTLPSDATNPSDAPVTLFGGTTKPSDAPVTLFGDTTKPSDAPVTLFGGTTKPSDAPVTIFGGTTKPSDATFTIFGDATKPSVAPVTFTAAEKEQAEKLQSLGETTRSTNVDNKEDTLSPLENFNNPSPQNSENKISIISKFFRNIFGMGPTP